MVEGQQPAAVAGVGHDRPAGIVAAPGEARGPGHEHGRDRVQAGISRGVGIGPELADELDLERGLLTGLPHGGRFEGLPVVDEAAGQGPAGRRVAAFDEDDAPAAASGRDLDDDVDGRHGIAELGAGHGFGDIVHASRSIRQKRGGERRKGTARPLLGTLEGGKPGMPRGGGWHDSC